MTIFKLASLSGPIFVALAALTALSVPALAQSKASPTSAVGSMGTSKEPIAIDANQLDVFDKEGRAVFTGDVVAVQGETTMRCAVMTVLYESQRGKGGGKSASAAPSGGMGGLTQDSSIKEIVCKGPVVIKTKEQTATGDNARFDRVANKVFLTGNATLSETKGNVMKGDRVAYDVASGRAQILGSAAQPRVKAIIVQGSDDDKPKGKQKPKGQ